MRARLFCKVGAMASIDVPIHEVLTIGRSSGRHSTPELLALDSEQISARHACITWDAIHECYILEDLGSTNGTELDGMPVRGKVRLEGLHVISFAGEFDFVFSVGSPASMMAEAPSEPAPVAVAGIAAVSRPTVIGPVTPFVPPRPAAGGETVRQAPAAPFIPPRPAAGGETVRQAPATPFVPPRPASVEPHPEPAVAAAPRLQLEVRAAGAAPRVHELKLGANRVGRLADNDIVIPHPTVSKQHAILIVDARGVLLQSISQNSRTFVGGAAIQQVELQRGAQIFFGEVETVLS